MAEKPERYRVTVEAEMHHPRGENGERGPKIHFLVANETYDKKLALQVFDMMSRFDEAQFGGLHDPDSAKTKVELQHEDRYGWTTLQTKAFPRR